MREVVTSRADRGVWTVVFVTVAALALLLAVSFAAPAVASSPAPPAGSPAPGDSASPSPSPTLTISLSRDGGDSVSKLTVDHKTKVTVKGKLEPAAGGEQIIVTVGGTRIDTDADPILTDAGGDYDYSFEARGGGDVVAYLAADPTVQSPVRTLAVRPKASVTRGTLVPYLKTKFVVKIAPSRYEGTVVLKVVHRKATVGTYKAKARSGQAVFQVPLRGVDGFALTFTLPAYGNLAARTIQTKVTIAPKTLSAGSKGPYVKGMLTGLQRLKFRTPGMGSTFTAKVKDSVMAFQKAYRLKRSYVFNAQCWRKLDTAKLIKARHKSPSTHIEVDKTRQILMIVKGGKPWGIICVSTGATGNTPEGTFRVQQKHPYTSSGFGGTLTRTMGFLGDFAIHGWPDVPPYPASHGCVREPIWACYWTYDNSWVGETVYVYR